MPEKRDIMLETAGFLVNYVKLKPEPYELSKADATRANTWADSALGQILKNIHLLMQ